MKYIACKKYFKIKFIIYFLQAINNRENIFIFQNIGKLTVSDFFIYKYLKPLNSRHFEK